MVKTNNVIGFYTDIFGNEIDEYELIERYSVCYEGIIFEGDSEGYNIHHFDKWEDAKSVYDSDPDNVCIRDNEYGVTFAKGDWS